MPRCISWPTSSLISIRRPRVYATGLDETSAEHRLLVAEEVDARFNDLRGGKERDPARAVEKSENFIYGDGWEGVFTSQRPSTQNTSLRWEV
jgi:hypothetical protein